LLLGLVFWVFDSLLYFLPTFLKNATFQEPQTLLDALILKVPFHHLIARLAVLATALLSGCIITRKMQRQEAKRLTAEQALQENQKQLSTIIDGLPALVAYIDTEMRYVYVNQSYAAWYGMTKETLISKRIPDLLPEDVYARALPRYQAVLRGETVAFENATHDKGGQPRVVGVKLVPHHDAEGHVQGFFGMIQDITARKQAEDALVHKTQQQEQLLDAAHNLISSLDTNEILTRIASSAKEILEAYGCTIYLLEPNGKTLTPVVAIEKYQKALLSTPLSVDHSLTGESVKAKHSLIFNHAAKSPMAQQIPGTPEEEDEHVIVAPLIVHDTVLGAMCLNRLGESDKFFTEDDLALVNAFATYASAALKNAQAHEALQETETLLRDERAKLTLHVAERTAELRATNAELSKALHAKDEFLATMSHELRTPLSAILALAELLQAGVYGDLNARQDKSLQGIEESGQHLLSLITDILDVSKIEAGKLVLDIQAVDVQKICQASIQFIHPQAIAKRLHVSLNLDEQATTIQADRRRLKQILINLLSNAVKFTPEDGTIGLEVQANPIKRQVHFTVWDTGIGIAADDQTQIFKPFTQLDSTLSRAYEGTGLGLTLVERLTRMHGGRVTLESQIGEGSRFKVTLPWSQADVQRVTLETEQEEVPIPVETDKKDVSVHTMPVILLAEDNEATRMAVSEYLSTCGYQVIEAKDGREAIAQAQLCHPDLIFMDIQMPQVNGLEAIRAVREDPAMTETPIIALTALAMPGDSERCLEAGATSYLTKPFTLQGLMDVIAVQLKV